MRKESLNSDGQIYPPISIVRTITSHLKLTSVCKSRKLVSLTGSDYCIDSTQKPNYVNISYIIVWLIDIDGRLAINQNKIDSRVMTAIDWLLFNCKDVLCLLYSWPKQVYKQYGGQLQEINDINERTRRKFADIKAVTRRRVSKKYSTDSIMCKIKWTKDKQWSTRHYLENKRSINMNTTENWVSNLVFRKCNQFLLHMCHCHVTLVTTRWYVMHRKRTGLWLRQTDHIRCHSWHRYLVAVNQVMVTTIILGSVASLFAATLY